MLAKLRSMAVLGIDAFEIGIEADISEMLPSFAIVGLPDGAVRESRERVMSAIKNCGFEIIKNYRVFEFYHRIFILSVQSM